MISEGSDSDGMVDVRKNGPGMISERLPSDNGDKRGLKNMANIAA